MATDLSDDIATQAVEPASVSADGQSASARPVADVILADQYLAAKRARGKRRGGIVFQKLINPGPMADGGIPQGGTFSNWGGG